MFDPARRFPRPALWLLRACLALLLGLGASNAMARDWQEVTTDHFLLYTDLGEADARELARDLEYFRVVLGYLSPSAPTDGQQPVRIYAFRNAGHARRVFARREVVGMYCPCTRGGVMAISHKVKQRWMSEGRRVLLHEYTHHFLRGTGFHYPAWYDEGFAEYLSTFVLAEDIAVVGAPPRARAEMLNDFAWLSAEQLLVQGMRYLSAEAPSRNARMGHQYKVSDEAMLYPQGWLVAHYLHDDPGRTEQLGDYLLRLNAGEAAAEAFEPAFDQNLSEFQLALQQYWRAGDLRSRGYRIPAPEAAEAISVRSMPDLPIDFWIAEAQMTMAMHDRPPRMQAAFMDALDDLDDDDAEMRLRIELDLVELANDMLELDAAEARLRDLVNDHPDHPRLLHEYARLLLTRARTGQHGPDESPASLIDFARSLASRGLDDHPDDAALLHDFVQTYVEDNRADALPGLRALGHLQTVYPQQPSIQRYAAALFAEAGLYDRALESVDFELNFARSDAEAEQLQEMREQILRLERQSDDGATD